MGSLSLSRKMLAACSLLFIALMPSITLASIDAGAAWLKAQQRASGEFDSPQTQSNPYLSTLESLSTFAHFNKMNNVDLPAAMEFVAPSLINNSTEHLAKVILIKHAVGVSFSSEEMLLNERQIRYSGFGYDVGYESDPLSTALALEVFAKVGSERPDIGYAIQYLLEIQKLNGSWSLENNSSDITLTAQVMKALWAYRNTYVVSGALQKASHYLLVERTSNGLWAELNSSAHALSALLNYLNDRTALTISIDTLAASQLPNGSFANDVYTTALALSVLHLSKLPAPDEIILSGKIIDGQSGVPLAGASVELTGVAVKSSPTDSTGHFAFRNLQPGTYTLKVSFPGYSSLTLNTLVFTGSKPDLGILKLSKYTVDPTTGNPVTTGTVRGLITDRRTGSAVSGATVSIPTLGLSATTDIKGAYQISNVPAGSLSISVSKSGYNDVSATATMAAQQTLLFSPTLQESISLGIAIRGVITAYGSDEPLIGAKIEVLKEGVVTSSTLSDANGSYSITGISAANIKINVSLEGYHPASASADPTDGTTLVFSPTLATVLEVPVIAKGGVVGTVVDAVTGRGIDSVTIMIRYESGAVINVVSGMDGEFSVFDMESGAGTLEVSSPGYQSMQTSLAIESGLILDLGHVQFTPISAVTSGKLFGYLSDVRTSSPISGGVVSLKNSTTNQLFELISGADGTFNFAVVPAGSYSIAIKATGYTQVNFGSVISPGDEIDLGNVLIRKPGIDALIPDVAVLAINRTALVSDMASFEASGAVDVTIINRGNAEVAVPFEVYAFEDLNRNGAYDATDSLLGKTSIKIDAAAPLKVDGSISASIAVLGKLSFRDAPIGILLDATNVLFELSEANNLSSTAGLCANRQKPNVDLALCMDSSGSVSAADFKLQLEGTAQAIENVVPRDGTVRISALQFASAARVEMSPTIVEEDNVQLIADKIRSIRKSGGGTAIHACIDSATTLLSTALPASSVQIIDVSTDGESPKSLAVAASARARTAGIDVLNAIGVGSGINVDILNAIVFPQPVGGERGFVLTVKGYQEYINAISGKIQRETKIADLSLGGATLIDNGFGANPGGKVILGNAGATTISESIVVSLYDAAPEVGGKLIGSQTIETDLTSGNRLEVTFASIDPAKLAKGKMVFVATLAGNFPECNADNNRQEISIASKRGNIELNLNGAKFGPNVDVVLSTLVSNLGALNGNYNVALTITDASAVPVFSFAARNLSDLLPNQSVNHSNPWNTGLIASGNYLAVAKLYDAQGNLLDSDTQAFVVSELDENGQTTDGTPLGQVAPFTDKPQYHIDDQVLVGYSVKNITRVHIINSPTVTIEVTAPSGSIAYQRIISYSSLLPEQLLQWQQQFSLLQAEVGTYQVVATLKDESGAVFGAGVSSFVIANDPVLALRGNIIIQSAIVDAGDSQDCKFTTINAGSETLTNQQFRYSVVNVDAQQVKFEESKALSLVPQHQSTDTKIILTKDYQPGIYACVLEISRGGLLSVLATGTFTVRESAIKLDGDVELGQKSRLLVLIDNAKTPDEELYLRSLLDNAGWFYTLVNNAKAFDLELTQGGYGAYALLSELVTLTPQTRERLKAEVALGNGLFVSNGHDRRHRSLEEALGIRVHSKQTHISGIEVHHSVVGNAWSHNFTESINSLTFDIAGGTVFGDYLLSAPQDKGVPKALGSAGDFNVFVLENHTSLASSIEGRMAVGGNLNLSSFSVGDKSKPLTSGDAVVVGGDVTFPSGRIHYGNLTAGGNVAGVGTVVRNGMAKGAVVVGNASTAIDFVSEAAYLEELSTNVAKLPATGTLTLRGGSFELRGDCASSLQVFQLSAIELASVRTFAVNCIPKGATVVINVLGEVVKIESIDLQALAAIRDKVLWNFPQAKTLKLASVTIEGSVLAPFAQVEQPVGRIEGQVIVKSWLATPSGFMSIHNRVFTGDLTAAFSTPSKNAIAHHQYQQGKTSFAGFDVLALALQREAKLTEGEHNPFANFLLSALVHVNPELTLTRAGKVIGVDITIKNTGSQPASGQATLVIPPNLAMMAQDGFTQAPDTREWTTGFSLAPAAQLQKTLYLRLPSTASSEEVLLMLQTGVAPELTTHVKKSLFISVY